MQYENSVSQSYSFIKVKLRSFSGTLIALIEFSRNKKLVSKVNLFTALAPVGRVNAPLGAAKVMSAFLPELIAITDKLGRTMSMIITFGMTIDYQYHYEYDHHHYGLVISHGNNMSSYMQI